MPEVIRIGMVSYSTMFQCKQIRDTCSMLGFSTAAIMAVTEKYEVYFLVIPDR